MSTLNTPQKVLDYIKRSGALVAQAEKRAAADAQKQAAVSALIPDVVEAMIQNGRITEDLREKAAAQLKDHARTLEILASVAAHRTDSEKGHLGNPAGVKTASASRYGVDGPFCGGPHSEERASDRELLTRLGIR